ncbi:HSFY1 protein, partial [Penelope pileata]|nr:HSFY1 protein [Penelope pileata]
LSFPKKLWLLAESDEFKTIWWDDGGRCIVIDEELFKVEVLGREGPRKVFQTESMKTFLRQLNQYGFTKLQGHLERSSSLPEFSAEEEAFAANRKLLVYFNLLFKRDYPQLLHHCKRR